MELVILVFGVTECSSIRDAYCRHYIAVSNAIYFLSLLKCRLVFFTDNYCFACCVYFLPCVWQFVKRQKQLTYISLMRQFLKHDFYVFHVWE